MKKRFLLGMSILLIASFFNLQSEEIKETNTESSSYILPGAAFTFAQLWFEKFKAKHTNAGFDKATFLISVEQKNPNDIEKLFPTWAASLGEIPAESRYNYGNLTHFKFIFGKKEDFVKLNDICKKLHLKSENLSETEEEFLHEVAVQWLHEIHHCNCRASKPNSSLSFFESRQEEFDADMHAIKHSTPEELKACASSLKRNYEDLLKNFHLPLSTPINVLKSLESKSCSSLKPLLAKSIDTLDSIQNVILTPWHPSLKTRIQYFSEAASKKQNSMLIIKGLLQACLINQEEHDDVIEPEIYQKLAKSDAPEIIQYFTEKKPNLFHNGQHFKDAKIDMLDRLLATRPITPFSSSALLAHALKN